MDREDWMFTKSMLPGGILMGGAVLGMLALSGLPEQGPLGAGLFSAWRWGPVVMGGAGLCMWLAAAGRYWQHARGTGYTCQCGGLLGAFQLKRGYRKCLGCGRRHYD